jgi:hypothetical protein
MIKVTEYEKHAEECRKMARHSVAPHQKAQLEEMAQAWDALARDRAEQLKKEAVAQAVAAPHNGARGQPH